VTLLRAIAAELRKAATLPGTYAAVAVAALGSIAITAVNGFGVRSALAHGRPDLVAYTSPVEAAFAAVPLGTVGAVIIGVIAISSEYTPSSSDAGGGRQVVSTLTAAPRRLTLLAAKAVAVVVLVAATAALTIPAALALATTIIGDAAPAVDSLGDTIARSLGAALYWGLTALIALAITTLTRSGIVPLIALITNSSMVSVSLLLSKVTPLARYLPDAAGIRLFARSSTGIGDPHDPVTGALVMGAWTAGLLAVAAVVLARRDA